MGGRPQLLQAFFADGVVRIDQHVDRGGFRRDFPQQAEPLLHELLVEGADSGGVAARPGEAGDQPDIHRVARPGEDDGDGRGRCLGG